MVIGPLNPSPSGLAQHPRERERGESEGERAREREEERERKREEKRGREQEYEDGISLRCIKVSITHTSTIPASYGDVYAQ